jgi:hypothetical protein
LKKIITGTVNFEFEPFYTPFEDFNNLEQTKPYDYEEVVIVITPGELYTSYEKILMPFDALTWYFLTLTVFMALLIIFLVKQLNKSIQNMIFGANVRHPMFNVVAIFFGMGLKKHSAHNFGRIIMIIFVFFCLIIRTAYQGVQFEMMYREMRKPPVKSVDELHEKNYTIYFNDLKMYFDEFAPIMDYLTKYRFETCRESTTPHDDSFAAIFMHGIYAVQYEFYYNLLIHNYNNSSSKLAFIGWKSNLIPLTTKLNYVLGSSNHEIINITKKAIQPYQGRVPLKLQQNIISVPLFFGVTKHCFLIPLADKVIPWLLQGGIIQYLRKNELERELIEKDELKVLSVSDLSFGFVVWLVACAASTIMYLVHWFMFIIYFFVFKIVEIKIL